MARIFPAGWRATPAEGRLARELDTLETLAAGLPGECAVYHDVHWTRVASGRRLGGDIDFIVVGPSGRLLLIEQKSGFLDETPDGLVAAYGREKRLVAVEAARAADALRERLAAVLDDHPPEIDTLLYCPDFIVRQPGTAGLDPSRIVDASRRPHLAEIVGSLCRGDDGDDRAEPGAPGRAARARLERIHRFLADRLELVPDVGAAAGQAETLYTRLSGGLANWARRLAFEPFRLRVTATAGGGKTQLALALLRDAVAAGRRPLYVCYNRPLADQMALVAPAGAEVATYHQLCHRMLRTYGVTPAFGRPDAFARLEAAFAELEPTDDGRFDELVIDEGQDFREAWRDTLLRLLRPDGRAWWLEDPMQNLYGRPEVPLSGWVRLTSDRNYRSPAEVVALLNRALPLPRPIEAGSPVAGLEVEHFVWHDEAGLLDATKRAITRAIGLGFRRDMVAVLTFRGRERSAFTPLDRLGAHRLKSFTGRYDLLGNPVYSAGDVLVDSVYRFKGQAAPCVVFTEIDFDELDELTMRKLFVGATRASMKLMLVASQRAACRLAEKETGDR